MTELGALERIARTFNWRRDGLRCDLCTRSLRREHRHVVELLGHRLLCTCPACALGVAERREGPYRLVPEAVRTHPNGAPSVEQWQSLGMPMRLAFFSRLSLFERWMAVVPSPAGAQSVPLPEAAWGAFVWSSPLAQGLAADVEALVVRGVRGGPLEAYAVPLDRCYELVGIVRQNWHGIDGGDALRQELEAFFERLRRASSSPDAAVAE